MTHFKVWAPRAQEVALQLEAQAPDREGGQAGQGDAGDRNARSLSMHAASGGWFELDLPDLPAEVDYRFALDGGDPLPDPRSKWQPAGVLGPSRTLDFAALSGRVERWDVAPLAQALVYELHVGSFTPQGTFDGAIEQLDHLVALGVTHVELMPVAAFPGARGWGYDGVALYAPQHAYGGPHGLARLLDACHARGLAVLLDVVYNHLGPHGNVLPHFGPYFTDRYRTPWGSAPNLDGADSDEVRRFFLDNAVHWLRDYRFDGLRVDATDAILDTSALHFVEELASEVHALGRELGRELVVIPENDSNDPRLVVPRERGGCGCDARWNDDFHHALHALLTGERGGYYADFGSLADLATALERVQVYEGRWAASRRRRHGRPVDAFGPLSGERFLAYAQTHDQVGNRARGERLAELVSPERLRIAAALVALSPFVPMLFQGEEWGASTRFPYFTDHPDPELGRAVSEGRRHEFAAFGWAPDEVPDPQDEATFSAAKLRWDEREREPHASLFAWHQRLHALRREHPDLGSERANVRVDFDERERWLVLHRGRVALAVNLSTEPRPLPLSDAGARTVLLQSGALPALDAQTVMLAPDGCAIAALAT